jgi:YebC/PmpR family DNA-binding regulatory protein
MIRMSGHSKWHNIKRKKESEDAKRGLIFTKVGRLITVAARQGGGDPDANPALRLAVEKAKQARMPKENIQKAIQKGVGAGSGENFEEVVYEGFGPGGIGFMVYALTDNRNRAVAEVKNIFSRHGGSLGHPGSTSYMFNPDTKEPIYSIQVPEEQLEKIVSIEEMLEDLDDVQEVYSNCEKI